MFTPVATSGWAYTCPSSCTWKSFPNVDEFTLIGVNCVSLGLLPVLEGSLCYMRTSVASRSRGSSSSRPIRKGRRPRDPRATRDGIACLYANMVMRSYVNDVDRKEDHELPSGA